MADDGREPLAAQDGLPYPDFASAAESVLAHLRQTVGLRLWAVTRRAGGDQVFLHADADPSTGYPDPDGFAMPWHASLCSLMAAGAGPAVAPRVEDVPAYAAAPSRGAVRIGAYAGAPLRTADGALFGSLCAYDPDPVPERVAAAAPLVVLSARLLSTVLAFELAEDEQRRRAERAEAEAERDPLTGLANRRAWDRLLAVEEARCARYGSAATVLVIDVNGLKPVNDGFGHAAGDTLLRTTADVLRRTARAGDLVARLGGDEFAVLAVQTDALGATAELARLRHALTRAGVSAALGLGVRPAGGALAAAWAEADGAMYRDKRSGPQLLCRS